MRVQERTVKRYFANGKGYAAKRQAYLALAKSELKSEMASAAYLAAPEDWTQGGWDFKDSLHEQYCKRFPLDGYPDNWSNEDRWKWVRDRATQMQQEDEAQP